MHMLYRVHAILKTKEKNIFLKFWQIKQIKYQLLKLMNLCLQQFIILATMALALLQYKLFPPPLFYHTF